MDTDLAQLGTIVRLQVQSAGLKQGELGRRRYAPASITAVSELWLDSGGVTGIGDDGRRLPDVHHRDHALSKNVDGINDVSILFTSHYDQMRERFGPHVTDGIAGESILVRCDAVIDEADLRAGLVILNYSGEQVDLSEIVVAEPCVEFTRFCLGVSPETRSDGRVTDALTFLRAGRRGFYSRFEGEGTTIRLGDRVFCRRAGTGYTGLGG